MPVRTLDPSDISDEERRQLLDALNELRSLPDLQTEDRQTEDRQTEDRQTEDRCTMTIEGKEVAIPRRLADEVIHLLSEVASGRAVSVDAQETELTTTEAAELLNVSRPHLVELLEDGEIPFHKVGTHRRVYRKDVLEYKTRQREEAEAAMQNLADQAQELGLGY
jgi:excisionase family DNA binding protein